MPRKKAKKKRTLKKKEKGFSLWMIISAALSVLIVASILTSGFQIKIAIPVNMVLITDSSCEYCYNASVNEKILSNYNLSLNIISVEYTDAKAQELIDKYNITKIPTFILSKEASNNAVLMRDWPNVGTIESDGSLVFRGPEFYASLSPGDHEVLINGSKMLGSVKEVLDLGTFNISIGNSSTRGDANSNITVIEFGDYECSYTMLAQMYFVEPLLAKYNSSIKFVFKQFPLTSIHDNALNASKAAICAKDQGKFWEYHEGLFNEVTSLNITDLRNLASSKGLNLTKFDACMDNNNTLAIVNSEINEGKAAGVLGTPTFFINGYEAVGVRELYFFDALIKEI